MGVHKIPASSYRFPPELNALLADRASRMGISKNALLIQVLWDFFGIDEPGVTAPPVDEKAG